MLADKNDKDNQDGWEPELKLLFQAEREQRALAEALFDVAEALNSTLQLDEVLNRILVNVGKVVPHDAANIMLVENGICRLVRMQGYQELGLADQVAALVFKVAETPNFQYMLDSGKPIAIQNTAQYPGWANFPITRWVHSYAGAPIRINGITSGFLNLDSATTGFYTQAHAQRLMAFANQCGVAINNAQLFERVEQLAITDDLTNLYNRRGLFSVGQREVDRAIRFYHPLSVLMLDIDNFKSVNDKFSYKTGDDVLRSFADRLRENVREVDVIGRYGGDEFIILLVENDLPVAAQVAERLRKSIQETPFPTCNGEINLTISIGVTAFSLDMANLETLFDRAGQDLHAAKQAGKNQIAVGSPPATRENYD